LIKFAPWTISNYFKKPVFYHAVEYFLTLEIKNTILNYQVKKINLLNFL